MTTLNRLSEVFTYPLFTCGNLIEISLPRGFIKNIHVVDGQPSDKFSIG